MCFFSLYNSSRRPCRVLPSPPPVSRAQRAGCRQHIGAPPKTRRAQECTQRGRSACWGTEGDAKQGRGLRREKEHLPCFWVAPRARALCASRPAPPAPAPRHIDQTCCDALLLPCKRTKRRPVTPLCGTKQSRRRTSTKARCTTRAPPANQATRQGEPRRSRCGLRPLTRAIAAPLASAASSPSAHRAGSARSRNTHTHALPPQKDGGKPGAQ